MHRKTLLIGMAALCLAAVSATGTAPEIKPAPNAPLKLALVIASHMVLQREMAVPIWGAASPGERIVVEFAGQHKEVTADASGKWMAKLDPMVASAEPRELLVQSKIRDSKIMVSDVLVGEVWVGSGQSNMMNAVSLYVQGDPVLAAQVAAAPYPGLRLLLRADRDWPNAGGRWAVADVQSISIFSAQFFAFGVRLHQELGVPVGLMLGAVGGTPSGFWLSEEAYRCDASCQEVASKAAAVYSPEKAWKQYQQQLAQWERAVEVAKAKGATRMPRKPDEPVKPGECYGKIGHFYEPFIRALQPLAIRGVLWDQGEGGTAIEGVDQFTLMGALIRGWRKEWGQGDFPFIYVQKPNGGGCAWDDQNPVTNQAQKFEPLPAAVPEDGDAVEASIRIMRYPGAAMTISSDLGPGIHPVNKSGYAHRDVDVALAVAYGRKLEYYGPLYQSHRVEGGKIRVAFTHVGQGLAFKHGDQLQGFAVAGADKVFRWADATIDGDSVVVSSAAVANPLHVRYAWSVKRPWANLFNKDGFPAIPFRTDE